jgi:hypothetical protein
MLFLTDDKGGFDFSTFHSVGLSLSAMDPLLPVEKLTRYDLPRRTSLIFTHRVLQIHHLVFLRLLGLTLQNFWRKGLNVFGLLSRGWMFDDPPEFDTGGE